MRKSNIIVEENSKDENEIEEKITTSSLFASLKLCYLYYCFLIAFSNQFSLTSFINKLFIYLSTNKVLVDSTLELQF